MSWQEELRKLDEELAAGRLSADEYRVRRDQVLSSAVTQDDQQESPSRRPDTAGTASDNHPAQSQNNSASDATQVVAPVAQPGQQQNPQQPTGAASYAQAPTGQQSQRQQQGSAAGGYQPAPASPPGGVTQQPTWNAPDQDATPPWGKDEFPPVATQADTTWATQGPESFDSFQSKRQSNTGKIVGGVLAIVLLAGIAIGAWFLWGNGESTTHAGGTTSTGAATAGPSTTPTPKPEFPVGMLPGSAEPYESVKSFEQVAELNYLTEEEFQVYQDAGASDVNFHIQNLPSGSRAVVLVTEVKEAQAAKEVVSKQRDIQVKNAAKKADEGAPAGVLITEYTNPDSDNVQIRAHYASGDAVVRVEIRNEKGIDEARDDLNTVLSAQRQAMPADA